eukprot:g11281.t1
MLDAHVNKYVKNAQASTPAESHGAASEPAAQKRRAASTAAPKKKGRAAAGTLNIVNSFAKGSGKPVIRTRKDGSTEEIMNISFAEPPPPGPTVPCPKCPRLFFNNQGLGVHPMREGGEKNVVSDGFPAAETARKHTRGAETRRSYSTREKASIVEELRELEGRKQEVRAHFNMTPLIYLEHKSGISRSNISKWQQEEDTIVADAADKVKGALMRKTSRPQRWFPEAEKEMYKMYTARRKKKVRVSTRWLTVTFKKLLAEKYPGDTRAKSFRASYRFAQKWAKRHNLSKRRKSNSKNKSVEERLPKIKVWHKRYRQLLQQPRKVGGQLVPWPQQPADEESGEISQELLDHRKWGRFLPKERKNTDQVPMGFVNGHSDTWDQTGALRVQIGQPFPGLEKRQCTVQPTFAPDGEAMRCAIIFRGKGRVSKVERAAYDERVDVFFQENAWADDNFCLEWAKQCFRPSLMAASGGRVPEAQTVLLADNLHGQTTEQFREYLYKECNTLLWLYASQCTDELQPVDAGYGRRIQVGVGVKLDLWLEHGENLQKWENGTLTASERRVLLTHWVGAVVEEIDADKEYRKRLFEKTGSGMTADGSEDDRINLEGLSGPYNFMDVEVDGSSDDEEERGDGSLGETGRGGGDLGPQQLGDDDQHEDDSSSCDESDEDARESEDPQTQLEDDDELAPGEEPLGMDIPDGFQLQRSPPSALDQSLVKRGVLCFLPGGACLNQMSTSQGDSGQAGSVADEISDLEERLGERLDATIERRVGLLSQQLVQQLTQQMASMLQGAAAAGGESRESSGAGSAAGGSQVVAPGAQSGAPSGGGTSNIPGRTSAEGFNGSQVGSQEEGEVVPSVVGGGDLSGAGAAVLSAAKFPRVQPPAFKGDRKNYLSFRADFLRAATLLDLKDQFVGTCPVADITKGSRELSDEGFSPTEISAGKNAWNLLSTALVSEHAKSIIRQCPNAKMALQELDAVYSPDTQGAKQELFRRFNRFYFNAKDDPIRALNDLELIWAQLNDKEGVELDMSFLLTKFIDILPPEYEAAQNSLGAMKEPTRNDVVRIVTTHREKIIRLGDEGKGKEQRKGQEQAYTAAAGGGRGGGTKGGGGGKGKGGGGKEGVICFRCNCPGHYKNDCKTERKDFRAS